MKNKELLWAITDAVTRYNKLPITIGLDDKRRSEIVIELQHSPDNEEHVRAVLKEDRTAIADLGLDGEVISLNEDFDNWLNEQED